MRVITRKVVRAALFVLGEVSRPTPELRVPTRPREMDITQRVQIRSEWIDAEFAGACGARVRRDGEFRITLLKQNVWKHHDAHTRTK